MRETPFFFDAGGHSLFGVFHEPERVVSSRGFVFCHPLGEEKLWTHRVFVTFARRLAAAGHPVMRFDFMGNGDSDGLFGDMSLTTADADLKAATRELRTRSGIERVGLVGLRWGAIVAALAAESVDVADRLVLWAPVIDGSRYMQDLLRVNLTTQMAVYKEIRRDREQLVAAMAGGETVNADGYDMAYPLYSQVSQVRLAAAKKQFAGPCLIVQIEPRPGRPRGDLQQLADTYAMATLAEAEEEPFWKEIQRFYGQAPNLYRVTEEWLSAQG